MYIECRIKRTPCTTITIGSNTYTFKKLIDGCHVVEVQDQNHINMLLTVSDTYIEYTSEPIIAYEEPTLAEVARVLMLDSVTSLPPVNIINGLSYSINDLTIMAFKSSGVSEEKWRDNGEDFRLAQINNVIRDLNTPPAVPEWAMPKKRKVKV